MTFGFIEAEKASFPISRMCRVLGVSRAVSSPGKNGSLSAPAAGHGLSGHIRTAFALSNGTYGSPRMHRDSSMRAMRSDGIARHA